MSHQVLNQGARAISPWAWVRIGIAFTDTVLCRFVSQILLHSSSSSSTFLSFSLLSIVVVFLQCQGLNSWPRVCALPLEPVICVLFVFHIGSPLGWLQTLIHLPPTPKQQGSQACTTTPSPQICFQSIFYIKLILLFLDNFIDIIYVSQGSLT